MVRNCAFVNCVADGGFGGAIRVEAVNTNGYPWIYDCEFENCIAALGGAMYVSTLQSTSVALNVIDCTFINNQALVELNTAGAIHAFKVRLNLVNAVCVSNIIGAGSTATGISVYQSAGSVNVEGSVFCSSLASQDFSDHIRFGIIDLGGNCFADDCQDQNADGFPDACQDICVADLNGDNTVGAADIGLLLGAWGTDESFADLNADGIVGAEDLGLLLGDWGGCS